MALSIDGSVGRVERQSVPIEEPHNEVRTIDSRLIDLCTRFVLLPFKV